jgi:hypothetical protein
MKKITVTVTVAKELEGVDIAKYLLSIGSYQAAPIKKTS